MELPYSNKIPHEFEVRLLFCPILLVSCFNMHARIPAFCTSFIFMCVALSNIRLVEVKVKGLN